jgi:hypothetical protein
LIGYTRELPARSNLQVQLSGNRYLYDELQPLIGEDRRDRLTRLDLMLTARDWIVYGFAPRLTMSTARNSSTIPLFSYTRRFAGIGLPASCSAVTPRQQLHPHHHLGVEAVEGHRS